MRKKLTAFLLIASGICAPVSFAEDRPNVVVMVADNLGFGNLSIGRLTASIRATWCSAGQSIRQGIP